MPVFPIVSEWVVNAVEADLGFTLPPLLREMYLKVSNGDFGHEIRGLPGGFKDDDGHDLVTAYREFSKGDETEDDEGNIQPFVWPRGLLPICDLGCAMQLCVDCLSPHYNLRVFDPFTFAPYEKLTLAQVFTSDIRRWCARRA